MKKIIFAIVLFSLSAAAQVPNHPHYARTWCDSKAVCAKKLIENQIVQLGLKIKIQAVEDISYEEYSYKGIDDHGEIFTGEILAAFERRLEGDPSSQGRDYYYYTCRIDLSDRYPEQRPKASFTIKNNAGEVVHQKVRPVKEYPPDNGVYDYSPMPAF